MDGQRLFEIWAPEGGAWSAWAKPVLFAQLNPGRAQSLAGRAPTPYDVSWAPPATDGTGIVLALRGEETVYAALELAERGYQPVPLFNTSPGPNALLNVDAIADAMVVGANALLAAERGRPRSSRTGGGAAPPVFMIDAMRLAEGVKPRPAQYDNRWCVFPQDFPSANTLRARGVRRMLVVHTARGSRGSDLDRVLLRWQKGGVELTELELHHGHGSPRGLKIWAPPGWRLLPALGLVMLGLRRNSAGGFGGLVPTESSGG